MRAAHQYESPLDRVKSPIEDFRSQHHYLSYSWRSPRQDMKDLPDRFYYPSPMLTLCAMIDLLDIRIDLPAIVIELDQVTAVDLHHL